MSTPHVEILGADRLPASGTILIPGSLDLPQLRALENKLAGRELSFLIEEGLTLEPGLQKYLERPGVQGAAFSRDDNPITVASALATTLAKNGVVLFLPGMAEARPGTPSLVPSEVLKFLCRLGHGVTALAVHEPGRTKLRTEPAHGLPDAVLSFGQPLAAGEASLPAYQESLYEAAEAAFAARSFLNDSLAVHLLRGLKMHGSTCSLHDGTDDAELPYFKILGVAIALSKEITKATKKKRVGILLPPGKGGLIANLAVIFANKVPVNLNFTASQEAVRSAIKQADLDKFITADPFVRKVSSFPWPPNRDLIFIERVIPQIKKSITKWVILSKVLPAGLLAKLLGIGRSRGNEEAILLFTSGSSGDPKGVPLTHRNLLANVCQFSSRIQLPVDTKILGSLPLFHSFGCTVTLWFPIIEGLNLVTYSSPLESKRLAELISEHQIPLFIATPTFLRGYLKRIEPEKLSSLKIVITGAEKLPTSLADSFEEKFGIRPMEGYGLTETSPVSNVNLPDLEAPSGHPLLPSRREGTVGPLLPGMAARITDPSEGGRLPLDRSGILWLRGPNVFPGYLGRDDLSEAVFEDGWFKTNDMARFDEDGFLSIEGRMSRFSKIAGEMVPHEVVEAEVEKVLGFDKEDERKIAIVGLPDPQKGEAIGLLSTVSSDMLEQEVIDLRYKLLDAGLPSLWCPKVIIPVEEIPTLASGKLDLKACQALARGE
ncbi:AMP-binding protein [Roseibacillus ishigakijimensis]|uniref:AMP-binding protein n=1 Tax=Roseibacillus ishigakijimensis TaxID=454146 RepID=A0A934RMN1_9BACT|nr:AMP-binding protein [Roseibacillus ishigakijimensis]MBK1834194.1 AMP-binding protein [Roseibacillus ishigakijimensis]